MAHVLLVFQKYDPNFLAGSLDEAYLDITNFCNDKQMTGGEVCLDTNRVIRNILHCRSYCFTFCLLYVESYIFVSSILSFN